jgi:hypothetical protein
MTNNQQGCEWCKWRSVTNTILLFAHEESGVIVSMDTRKTDVSADISVISGEDITCLGGIPFKHCPECGRPFNAKPMTLEEAAQYGRPVWVEQYFHQSWDMKERGFWVLPEDVWRVDVTRGRFWTRPPTPEQSAAWPWEEEGGVLCSIG